MEEYVISFFFVNPFAVSSSPVDVPQIKYGMAIEKETSNTTWSWSNISSPIFRCSDKVCFIFFWDINRNHFLKKILFYILEVNHMIFGFRLDLCCPLSSAIYLRSLSRMLMMVKQKVFKLLWFLTHGYLILSWMTCWNFRYALICICLFSETNWEVWWLSTSETNLTLTSHTLFNKSYPNL